MAPLTDDARMKLVSLDVRLKGRVPPCLPKSLDGGSPEPLPWVPVAASAAVTPRGGAGGSGKKPKPKAKGGKPPLGGNEEGAAGPWGGAAMEGSDAWRHDGGGDGGGGGSGGMWDAQPSDGKRARKSNARYEDSPDRRHYHGNHPQQGGGSFERPAYPHHPSPPPQPNMDRSLLLEGRGQNGSQHADAAQGGVGPGAATGRLGPSSGDGGPGPPPPLVAVTSSTPVAGGKKRKAGGGGGGADALVGSSPKKPKPPPSFSLATFAGGLDGSETRGLPSAEFVGSCFQRGRKDGLLLYYVDKAPRDYPFQYESKAAGAASLDWSLMRKHLKVDAFCMETFRWYGAKVADVSQERQQVKVRAWARIVAIITCAPHAQRRYIAHPAQAVGRHKNTTVRVTDTEYPNYGRLQNWALSAVGTVPEHCLTYTDSRHEGPT